MSTSPRKGNRYGPTSAININIIALINESKYTIKEIADKAGCSPHTVSQVRSMWSHLITGTVNITRTKRRRPNPFVELPDNAVPMKYWNRKGVQVNTDGIFITPDGDIYQMRTEGARLQHVSLNSAGYAQCGVVGATTFIVHRALACTFVPTDNRLLHVDHIDTDRTNNKLSNLRWLTQKENVQRKSWQK